MSFGCQAVQDVEPLDVGATYWFTPPAEGAAYPVTIRFSARPVTRGKPTRREERIQYERVNVVVPGSGPVCVTTRFGGVTAGEWEITAAPANNPREPDLPTGWANVPLLKLPRATTTASATFSPIARVLTPGARLGAWPALVSLGVVVALAMQAWLAARHGLGASGVFLISAVASLVGLGSAKIWYLVQNRERPRSSLAALSAGMCIQGFVTGAVAALVTGAVLLGKPVGTILDITIPGLLFAMAIGRLGCLLGGCCAGRPTASRFGIWSSDRRVGMRRVPVQLLESGLAASLATVALLFDLYGAPAPTGITFVAGVAAYTGLRQLLFPLRSLTRQTSHGRTLTMIAAFAVLAVAVAVAVAG